MRALPPDLDARINELMLADQARLRRSLSRLRKQAAPPQSGAELITAIHRQLEEGLARVAQRRSRIPDIDYPAELPVTAHVDELLNALQQNQVVIVAGHTGSGKSTQLPKICLAAGRGIAGQIAHTQPRRLAARSIAQRLADELRQELGAAIGYQVRFGKTYSADTLVKVMTDGILLNEIERDPQLLRYDTIIIDEAHERTLNIDFLLAYAKQLLPKRPELKLVVTSATIDTQRFADYFNQAPVIEVSGTLYPIDVRYRPPEFYGAAQETDVHELLGLALRELSADSAAAQRGPRDILAFLSTEQEIHEARHRLRAPPGEALEILPLYARLSQKEQQKIFSARKPPYKRRLILATNIAETSLTVPGIRYVIDTGYARLSRYSYRSKIQRLPIEPVSQASADQRKGRCGRLADGICIRLYSEQDLLSRPLYTEPEILRTNLAAVILKLLAIGVSNSQTFPFIQPPDRKQLNDGLRLLQEMHAVDERQRLTGVGRQLARLPVEPRLGRVLIAGAEYKCLQEMLVISAALSVVDPRERPLDRQQAADILHARFSDPRSDFISLLKLWRYLETKRKALSAAQYRKLLRKEFLSSARVRDWRDIYTQLLGMTQELRLTSNKHQASYAAIHQALLTGFLTHVGAREDRKEYRGVRDRRFKLFPGSGLYARPPRWILAAELVETQALYARTAADVRVAWVAHAARHLASISYAEPHWDVGSERVMAYAKRKLYGLVIAEREKAAFAPVDPVLAHEVFIRSALVEQQWCAPYAFFRHNQQSLHTAADIAARLRRPELLHSADDILYEVYAKTIPAQVADAAAFKKWSTGQTRRRLEALQVSAQQLLAEPVSKQLLQQYPATLKWSGNQFALRYRYAPGEPDDGVTALLPQHLLAFVPDDLFAGLVPGMLRQKCVQLLKTLPKAQRKQLAPVPDTVDEIFPRLQQSSQPLLEALAELIWLTRKVRINAGDWRQDQLPQEYRMRYSIVDEQDRQLACSRNLTQLKQQFASCQQPQPSWFVQAQFDGSEVEHGAIPELPEQYVFVRAGLQYTAYPGLVIDTQVARCCLFHRLEDARKHSALALAMLAARARREQAKSLRKQMLSDNAARLHLSLIEDHQGFRDDCMSRIFYEAFACAQQWPVSPQRFNESMAQASDKLLPQAELWEKLFREILAQHFALRRALDKLVAGVFSELHADIDAQLRRLLYPGFIRLAPVRWLRHYPRFLQAACYRVERIKQQGKRDALLAAKLEPWLQRTADADMTDEQDLLPWLLEEYRVSLFAQHLKTSLPVSATRLQQHWQLRSACEASGVANVSRQAVGP